MTNLYKNLILLLFLFLSFDRYKSVKNAQGAVLGNQGQAQAPKKTILEKMIERNSRCIYGKDESLIKNNQDEMIAYLKYNCELEDPTKFDEVFANSFGSKVKRLGSGSFGTVYWYQRQSVSNPSVMYDYAIKVPSMQSVTDLFKEVNNSLCLVEGLKELEQRQNKPSSRKFMGYIKHCLLNNQNGVSPQFYFAMEYFPSDYNKKLQNYYNGKSFNDFKSNPRATPQQNARNKQIQDEMILDMYYMSKELADLHAIGFAHRDLKGENFMVDNQGHPIIADFGISSVNGNTRPGLAGTPYYIDFEILQNKARNLTSIQTDVYSLGIIFASIILGKDQFKKNIDQMFYLGNQRSQKLSKNYSPKFSNLKLPKSFNWIFNMVKGVETSSTQKLPRWDIKRVLGKLITIMNERGIENPFDDESLPQIAHNEKVMIAPDTDVNQKIKKAIIDLIPNKEIVENQQIPLEQVEDDVDNQVPDDITEADEKNLLSLISNVEYQKQMNIPLIDEPNEIPLQNGILGADYSNPYIINVKRLTDEDLAAYKRKIEQEIKDITSRRPAFLSDPKLGGAVVNKSKLNKILI